MKKLVAENLNEYNSLEFDQTEKLNEALTIRGAVEDALKNPNDQAKADSAIKASFKVVDNIKAYLLKLPLEKKIEVLKAGAEKLKDPKAAYLKLVKTKEGKWVVGAVGASGGAQQTTAGK